MSSNTIINKDINNGLNEIANEEDENTGDNSNYCSFMNTDCVSVNSIPFNTNDIYIQKAINDIKGIVKQTKNIQRNIEHFHGTVQDHEYLFLEDTLIKLNMKLDAIESNGNDTIKDERKSAVLFIEFCLKLLDSKLSNNNRQQ